MASGYWSPVAIASAVGPTVALATMTTISPVTAYFTFPPNALSVGSQIRIKALGQVSKVTAAGTIQFQIVSVTGSAVAIHDTGTLNLQAVTLTTLPFELETELTCRATGSGTSANFIGVTRVVSPALLGGTLTTASSIISSVSSGPGGAPAVGTGFDSTQAWQIFLYGSQGVTTGSLIIQTMSIETGGIALT